MKMNPVIHNILFTAVFAVTVTGCAMNPLTQVPGSPASLPLIPGEVSLQVGKTKTSTLKIPDSMQLSTNGILTFSPIEFSSQKNHFGFEAATLPLGRYVAVRHSGEGITADLPVDETRSFNVRYEVRYPDLQAASRDFPGLASNRYHHLKIAGKPVIEIEQWHMRLSMIISQDRRAFRVLLDKLDYTAPNVESESEGDTVSQDAPQAMPVVVVFYYRHPDSRHETLIQQNIFFEFKVANFPGRFHGKPQVSGWLPLPLNARVRPYTVGIVVAEVHEKREDFYKKLFNMIKNVRGLI